MSDLDDYMAGRDRRRIKLSCDPSAAAEELSWTFGGVTPAARWLEEVLRAMLELVR